MLKLENINVTLNGSPILENLNATINTGDVIMIIGPNGTGKSTLFNAISGRLKPQSGRIIINDQDITPLSELKRTKFIARLFQDPKMNTVDNLSVHENIVLAMLKNATVRPKTIAAQLPDEVMDLLSLVNGSVDKLLKRPMGGLSGGQRQMVALMMATINPPQMLLLDEPTAALDPVATKKMLSFSIPFIEKHRITTLFITHDLEFAKTLGNRLWIMKDKTIKNDFGPEKQSLSIGDLNEFLH